MDWSKPFNKLKHPPVVKKPQNQCSKCSRSYSDLETHNQIFHQNSEVENQDSVHEEKNPDKCLLKKNIEVEEKEEKKVRNSTNQNLSDEKKYAESNSAEEKSLDMNSAEEESLNMNSDDSERFDYEDDRTYDAGDAPLIGKKLRCLYKSGWHTGKIEYFNTRLEAYIVLFHETSDHDCIKESDIDGTEIILLEDNLPT